MVSNFGTVHERISTLNNLKYQRILPASLHHQFPQETKIIMAMTDKDPSLRPGAQTLLKSALLDDWARALHQEIDKNSEEKENIN
mmetsp:Transcript_25400/g.19139  ORF Transcript_25400/g.19139 Transcript_25400/m.19139 type:complete len:85 (+) Transcript_25400:2419-2673(+)